MSSEPFPARASANRTPARARRWWWLLPGPLALLVAAGVYLFWPRPVIPPPAIITTGLDPEVAESLQEALREVTARPRSGDAWGRLGARLFGYGMHSDAVPCLAQAEALDGRNVRWPYFLGLALMEADPAGALACLRRAGDRAGGDFAPHLRLAEVLLHRGCLDEAESEFRRTLQLQPGNPTALLGLGRVALLRGAAQESLGQLLLAEDSPFTRRAVRAAMSEAYRRLGDEPAAVASDQRARHLPPDQIWPDPFLLEMRTQLVGNAQRLERAGDHWKAGDIAGSLELLEENIRKQPGDAASYALLGSIHFDQKNTAAAEAALREAVRLNAEDSNSYLLLGGLLFQQQRLPQACDAFRQSWRLRPASSDAAYNLSQCLVQQGDRAAAIEVLRTALRYRPDAASLHLELGKQLLKIGKPAEAVPELQTACLLAPSDTHAQTLVEEARRLAGRTP